ncbi:MAG: oligosaccharide flippase family protein [Clostridia bacterium]|nr:oligosaccharide flippase family protein [Clostridia bacterium]
MALSSTEIQSKSKKSVKWSLLGEIFAKIAVPLSTMVLARLLTPEIYGIATAVTIVVTFCETVANSGFAKFIIQHDFENHEEYEKYFAVSFYVSLILSFALCAIIIIFRYPLSAYVGNSGYEIVLMASSIQIPFAAVNALFIADLKRRFLFKKLFLIRIVYSLVPFAVTIPLAFLGMGYWALVIGTIAGRIIQMPFLIKASKEKIKFYFSFFVLKKMLSASFAMIVESIIIWLCSWISTIIAANFFDQTTVGIIKVANSTVDSIFSLFGTAFVAVLFPTLSRLKNDKKAFEESFFSIQSAALSILIPLGVGAYFFANIITTVFLGDGWTEAIFVIAVFSLTKPLLLCFNNFLSEVFRSKGHFYSSIIYQLIMLVIDVVLRFTVGKQNYSAFIYCTTISNILITIIAIIILKYRYNLSFFKQSTTFLPSIFCSFGMIPLIIIKDFFSYAFLQSIFQIISCAFLYFIILKLFFPKIFDNIVSYLHFSKKEKQQIEFDEI